MRFSVPHRIFGFLGALGRGRETGTGKKKIQCAPCAQQCLRVALGANARDLNFSGHF